MDIDYIIHEYAQNRSITEIAREIGEFPNAVRRALIKNGVKIRGKAEAQSVALATGRAKHPTEGTQRSNETKLKISTGVSDNWENMSDEKKKEFADKAREIWNDKTSEEIERMHKLAGQGIRRSAKEGSKLEKFLYENLTKRQIVIDYHRELMLPNAKLHFDLFVPSLSTVIEIDGPSHFLPIWGNEELRKTQASDAQKNGLILNQNLIIIRVKQMRKNLSLKCCNDTCNKVYDALMSIQAKFPDNRLIEIEVK